MVNNNDEEKELEKLIEKVEEFCSDESTVILRDFLKKINKNESEVDDYDDESEFNDETPPKNTAEFIKESLNKISVGKEAYTNDLAKLESDEEFYVNRVVEVMDTFDLLDPKIIKYINESGYLNNNKATEIMNIDIKSKELEISNLIHEIDQNEIKLHKYQQDLKSAKIMNKLNSGEKVGKIKRTNDKKE